jgi:hypothetical protein
MKDHSDFYAEFSINHAETALSVVSDRTTSSNSLVVYALSTTTRKSFSNSLGTLSTRDALIEVVRCESNLGSKSSTWAGMVNMVALATVLG